jgi:beta-glucuronidase
MRRYLGFLPVFLIAAAAAGAPVQTGPAALITDIDHRSAQSLDGPWHFLVDPYDTGYYDFHRAPRNDGYFLNAHPADTPRDLADSRGLVEYDFSRAETLNVPGDWNSQRRDLFFYEGTVWYEKDFTYHPTPGRRVFLYVGAASTFSRVWVDGRKVGEHDGGFTPFNCEVTNLLAAGNNFVVISVDNTRRVDGVPALATDWWNYGGIIRDVKLVEVPDVFIGDYSLHLVKGSADRVEGWVDIRGATAPVAVRLRIPELNIDLGLATDSSGRASVAFSAPGLTRWSPEVPKLYDVDISSGLDDLRDSVGFRTIEVRGTDILLNGRPIFLRGVCIQEEAPYRSGRAWSEEDARTLLGWARSLHVNFVRLAHFPHDERMLRLADQMGIMVWSELPVYWAIDWANPATLANARQQLSEEITRDRNRASVILWSVGNEAPVTADRLQFMGALARSAREFDPTRLVTAACLATKTPKVFSIDDPLGAELDVLGCNEYIGWYDRKPEDADHIVWRSAYNKPLIMSEFGADAKFGLHGDRHERWTEEYQEDVYVHQLGMLDKIPFLRGMSPWILMDFRSPRRPLPGIEDNYNRKGLFSDHGEKKKAFSVLESYYDQKSRQPAP